MKKVMLALILMSCGSSPKTCREISDESKALVGVFKINKKFIKDKARWFTGRDTINNVSSIRFVGIEPMYDRVSSGDWLFKKDKDTVYVILKKEEKSYYAYSYYDPCPHGEPLLRIDSAAFVAAWYERLEDELRKNSLPSKVAPIP